MFWRITAKTATAAEECGGTSSQAIRGEKAAADIQRQPRGGTGVRDIIWPMALWENSGQAEQLCRFYVWSDGNKGVPKWSWNWKARNKLSLLQFFIRKESMSCASKVNIPVDIWPLYGSAGAGSDLLQEIPTNFPSLRYVKRYIWHGVILICHSSLAHKQNSFIPSLSIIQSYFSK